jgi:hypothetical protein
MTEKVTVQKVVIEGKTYVPEDSVAPTLTGNRAVLVVDRGWIFAGDVTVEGNRIKLSRAVQVLRWERNGFAGLVADPKGAGANLLKMVGVVDIPSDAEIFRVPVPDTWGVA